LKFPQTPDLFEYEVASLENLKILIATPVKFNSAKEIPWHPSLLEIKNRFPVWYYKYADGYKCIDRLIILVQRNKYIRSKGNQKYELVYIGGGYIVDLKQNIQY
jgi:hypothetical protein